MKRTATDVNINIAKIRRTLGMADRKYYGTSRDSLLVIEGRLLRLSTDFAKNALPFFDMDVGDVASKYGVSLDDATDFLDFINAPAGCPSDGSIAFVVTHQDGTTERFANGDALRQALTVTDELMIEICNGGTVEANSFLGKVTIAIK